MSYKEKLRVFGEIGLVYLFTGHVYIYKFSVSVISKTLYLIILHTPIYIRMFELIVCVFL